MRLSFRSGVRFSVLAVGLAVLTSCEARFDWPWLEKKASAEEVRATGHTGTEDRSVGEFTSVTLEGMGTLLFDNEVPAGVLRIRADEGVMKAIRADVNSGRLTITEDGLHGPGNWDIEFRLAPTSNLSEITLGGLGEIETVSPLRTSEPLTVTLDGLGRIELEVQAPSLRAFQKGSGELQLRGTTGSLDIVAQGLGKVDAENLASTSADVLSQGVGEVTVRSTEKLKVRAQGLGAVHFYGNPASTDIQTEGLTQVTAAD